MVLLLVLASATAATHTVPTTATPTLAAAVEAASDGDEILIAASTSAELRPVVIDVSVTIRGKTAGLGIPPVVIDSGAVVTLQDVAPAMLEATTDELDSRVEDCMADAAVASGLWLEGAPLVCVLGGDLTLLRVSLAGSLGYGLFVTEGTVHAEELTAYGWASVAPVLIANGSSGSSTDRPNVTITAGEFTSNSGGVVHVHDAKVTISGSSFVGNTPISGGDIDASSSEVLVTDSVFTSTHDVEGSTFGGSIRVRSGSLVVERAVFDGYTATYGGAIYADGATTVSLLDTDMRGGSAWMGGGLYASNVLDLVVQGATLESLQATSKGGALYATGSDVSLRRLQVTGNTANDGGALWFQGGSSFVVADSDFSANGAVVGSGGAIGASDAGGVVQRATFCGNYAQQYGGALWLDVQFGYDVSVLNDVFVSNRAYKGAAIGTGALGEAATVLEIANNTLVDNESTASGAITAAAGRLVVVNDIIQGSPIGLTVYETGSFEVHHNLWYGNTTDLLDPYGLGVELGVDEIFASPRFVDYSAGDCASDLRLAPDSPAIDAGSGFDGDGTVADIGAYGGEGSALLDGDADGFNASEDCDDADPTVHPDALDLPADGIDQDCDGSDASCDGDGDGVTSPLCGGEDCDDADASVHPRAPEVYADGRDQDCDGADHCDFDEDGALAIGVCGGDDCDDRDAQVTPGGSEIYGDGIDQDCNGYDGGAWIAGGGGCSTSAGAGGALGALLAAGLLRRRRA